MNILVAYDGTLHAKKALKYGIGKVRAAGSGAITVLQVFDRSLFVDYDAGLSAEELARSEAAKQLEEARQIAEGTGSAISITFITDEGQAVERVSYHAGALRPDLVLAPPRYREIASSLSCPVTIIPGTILAPVDSTDSPEAAVGMIVQEAEATGSKVLVLGVVPVHLYSKEEKKELERVSKATAANVKRLKKTLAEKSIEVLEAVRSGYPDEEILKAASENAVSLILLPSGSTTPSELSKAASILLDESERLKWPVFLLPAAAV